MILSPDFSPRSKSHPANLMTSSLNICLVWTSPSTSMAGSSKCPKLICIKTVNIDTDWIVGCNFASGIP